MKVTRTVTLVATILLLSSAALLADPTIKVTFPEKGAYLYWLVPAKTQPTAPKHVAGQSAEIDLAAASPSGKLGAGELRIYDPKSGSLAVKSLENLVGKKELKLKSADFDRVGRVRITLKPADAKPDERIESAVVTLKDANSDTFTSVVDPTSEGVAEFRNVAAGQESVTVAYDGGKMTMELEVPIERQTPIFTHELVISSDVRKIKVGGAPAATSPTGENPAPAAPKPEPSRNGILTTIAGVIFLSMIVFIGYVVLKAKGVTLEGSLKKAGVQLPQDGADIPAGAPSAPAAEPVDPSMCQFCGQRKDPVTGKCACSIDSGAPAATATGAPRLIGTQGPYSGNIFEVTGDEMTIGRDVTNGVDLSDDSTSSRRHAKIDRSNGGFIITDLGSSNGTFVNNSRITGSQPLNPGDEIQIGSTKFRFES